MVQKTTKCEDNRGKRRQDHITDKATEDKQNAAIREYLASKADFVGAIRLPSDAFKREGTAVVTDILFMRKRLLNEPPNHADPEWLGVAPLTIDGTDVAINRYYLNFPAMVLGAWTGKDTLWLRPRYWTRHPPRGSDLQ